ncbi:MAG: response regulator transcription factor [Lachnospiraceae bacterium]|nr:response regulator transcription factor [Lachnospiraceae bacterium]
MAKILIVEDDISLRDNLKTLISDAGYEAVCIEDFSNTLQGIIDARSDLVLLDITLPGDNGEQILRKFRAESDIPVIMVTSRTLETDEVLSMSFGADDYVTKPYNPTILLLRIQAVLKRYAKEGKEGESTYKNLSLNVSKGSFSVGDQDYSLTKNELIILKQLFDNKEKIVSRDELMTILWDNAEYLNDNALTVNISRLRTKLMDAGSEATIETRKKQGYILI